MYFTAHGVDSDGEQYASLDLLWAEKLGGTIGGDNVSATDNVSAAASSSTLREAWYTSGLEYWKGADATVDGVLGKQF
jgi:hypothetical protein